MERIPILKLHGEPVVHVDLNRHQEQVAKLQNRYAIHARGSGIRDGA